MKKSPTQIHQDLVASGFPERLATGLVAQLEDLGLTRHRLEAALARFKTELVCWIVGTVGLGTILTHFWK
jgi:hypothetical protein